MEGEIRQWLAEGIARAKAGERDQARELLLRVVERDERNAQGWLWLSGVVDSLEDRRVALENVLAIEPGNALARAGLDWLERQAADQSPAAPRSEAAAAPSAPVSEPALAGLLSTPQEPPAEQERCPYCGQVVAESDEKCLHCAQPLVLRTLKRSDFPARVSLLTVAWGLQAVADVMSSVIMFIMAMMAGSAAGLLGNSYLQTLGGAAFSGKLTADLWRTFYLFVGLDVLAAAWSLAAALILPARRPAAPALALFIAAFHIMLAVTGFALGMSSLVVGATRLALALFLGFLLLEAQGDFVWEAARQRLELDPASRSAMDYYTQGRYYRRIYQTAKAILHLERAVELAPERYDFRVSLGNAYYAMNELDRAAEQFRVALQINPEASDVSQFLDAVTVRLSSKDVHTT